MPVTFECNPDLAVYTGRNLQYTFQGQLSYGQIDRAFFVRVVGETIKANIQGDAENYVRGLVPQRTPEATQPLCTARGYSVKPESDDCFIVTVSYIYNAIPWDATVWTIESDSYTEAEDTDVQYDPADSTQTRLIPIKVDNYILDWLNPTDTKPIIPGIPAISSDEQEHAQPAAYGIVSSPRLRKRWSYTKQIYDHIAALTYDSATVDFVGCVNSTDFTGVNQSGVTQGLDLPAGTVLCFDAGLNYAPYQAQYLARAILIYKPEGWQPWARWTNSVLGVPDNLFRPTNPSDPTTGNGMIRTTAIRTADLNALLALI